MPNPQPGQVDEYRVPREENRPSVLGMDSQRRSHVGRPSGVKGGMRQCPKQKPRRCLEVCGRYSGFITSKSDRAQGQDIFQTQFFLNLNFLVQIGSTEAGVDIQKTESLKKSPSL